MRVDVLKLSLFPGVSVRVFLVQAKGITVLVDAGAPYHGAKVARWLEKQGVKPDVLYLTHAHFDHFGGAAYIHTAYPAMKVYAPMLARQTLALGRVTVPQKLGRLPGGVRSAYAGLCSRAHIRSIHAEGDGTQLESAGITVVPTPGHCPDHTSLMLSDGTLLAGDALVSPPKFVNTWCDDPDQALESAKVLAGLKPHRILASHVKEYYGPISVQ